MTGVYDNDITALKLYHSYLYYINCVEKAQNGGKQIKSPFLKLIYSCTSLLSKTNNFYLFDKIKV